MKIEIPIDVAEIIDTIEQAGFEAYAVGGCVRDCVLGREPKDWDITTNAKPHQVKELFRRTIDTGIQHGTVTVMMGNEGYEITTYRIDGEYEDGRHPKEVCFTGSLAEDLRRRDFTMNAMAYHPKRGLVDLYGGIEDIQNGIIRCVGCATERFTEDALRMMRAVRFAGETGFAIEEETLAAMKQLSSNLSKVSAERIRVELEKLLVSMHPERLLIAYETGLTAVFMPEFDRLMETGQNNPHHCYRVGEHTIQVIMHAPRTKVLRLAALFHDFGKAETKTTDEDGIDHFPFHQIKSKEMTIEIMKRLKFDNDTIKKVSSLVEYHDHTFSSKESGMRKNITKIGLEQFPELFELKRADMLGQSTFQREEKEAELARVIALYEKILAQQDCLSMKDLAVKGADLMQVGIPGGKQMGTILNTLFAYVLEHPKDNERELLLELAKKLYQENA